MQKQFESLEDVVDSVGVGISYFMLELKEILPFEQDRLGIEPIIKLEYYNCALTVQKLMDDEKENKNRKWSYRVFKKKKASDRMIDEFKSMNKMDLTGWLS